MVYAGTTKVKTKSNVISAEITGIFDMLKKKSTLDVNKKVAEQQRLDKIKKDKAQKVFEQQAKGKLLETDVGKVIDMLDAKIAAKEQVALDKLKLDFQKMGIQLNAEQ